MFFRHLKWNVVGWFRIVSAISTAVILAGVIAMIYNFATTGKPLRLGLSFTGGTDVSVKFQQPVVQADVRSALEAIGSEDISLDTVSKSGDAIPNERFTISTQTAFGNDTTKLWDALGKVAPIDRSQSEISSVGPSLSHEYLFRALEALVIAISIQFIYIAFRFGWNYIFGLVTVIALVRDALMMIGIYAISGKRADDAFLAAVLTVIGYSVMDTIVILDRIRENSKVMAGEVYEKIVNTSILQTMTRSLNTLATVVITLVALLAFGGASLQNFAFALLVGICSGGYHSIFFSAPLVHVLRERQRAAAAKKREALRAANGGDLSDTRGTARVSPEEREKILSARRERRAREKDQSKSRGPARYRRKSLEAESYTPLPDGQEVDPLDAQLAGYHDDELELGHEEIHLNLPDELEPVVNSEHVEKPPETDAPKATGRE